MRLHCRLVVALSLLPLPLAAQQPAPPAAGFGEEVEVSEVLLDVLVTDRAGNVIVGLTRDDFEVSEDGRPVDLAAVSFYSNRPRLDAAGARLEQAAAERYFVLLFHDQGMAGPPTLLTRQLDAGRRAGEWLRSLQLDDYVAVTRYDSSLEVHSDFTRDREALAKAIDAAVVGKEPDGNWPSRLPPEGGPSLLRNLPRGRELSKASETEYEALEVLARAMAPLVGRKNLVLFSGGFGRLNDFGQFVPDPRYQEPMERTLNDANVAVYTVDLFPPGTDHPLSGQLSRLADETGGRYYPNIVNFVTPLEQIATETSGYYLLAYQSPHRKGESGFQEVRVRLRNPDFRVRAREGYLYGKAEASD